MKSKIAGWVKVYGSRWHAVRQDGRAACGPVEYHGAPVPFAKTLETGVHCQRIGCDNARRDAERAANGGAR